MKIVLIISVILFLTGAFWKILAIPINKPDGKLPNGSLLNLSSQLLYNVKTDRRIDSVQTALSNYSLMDLQEGLSDDNARKAFWINMYNANYQIFAIHNKKTKDNIYTDKEILFADKEFSLDDIEHGILRKYRWKYGLGYLPQFFPSKSIKQLAVNNVDFRIHFALNCGAKSCPPIAFYQYDLIDEQLDLAARSFLQTETEINSVIREVHVTKIMQWFKGDFGGENGIRAILLRYLNKDFSDYRIVYKDYDWTTDLKNFTDDSQ
ncbi:hypothetical protein BH09BAC3_BH09BAC3_33000 [soil metagenome]